MRKWVGCIGEAKIQRGNQADLSIMGKDLGLFIQPLVIMDVPTSRACFSSAALGR